MKQRWKWMGITGLAGIAGAAGLTWSAMATNGDATAITVYKTPTCDCCTYWEDHLRENGFTVESVETNQQEINQVRRDHGITPELVSCHVGVIDGYAIEGHVPAADIERLLEEELDIAGLSVPGMPIGSPGMEMPNQPDDAYDVVAFNEQGQTRVFNRYTP